ncbi:SDR family NAD(P)-dependent oxidoreductase [Nocardioides nitrophenolicus]|uniref:SDR family NAD(P)-dependent oxidoreductase n=1 Tax=Nocardioides nitrophenolicus TaxID=60489 RepID=UPI00195A8E8E|nr:3-oxoacyl-ACP reductase family protein [Nocardioides nitrophenolicus]MBM7518666.1 NAD(P)-dependent dehydrogenase (short-subunit alcohol dehydrogenase family) [Nocardioides nitrophenolicus]
MSSVAVVTGGAKGIGRAISRQLADAGHEVVLTGRDRAALDAEVAVLTDRGLAAHARQLDVSDPASVDAAFDDIHATLGATDVLVNCAGVIVRGDAETYADEDWLRVIDTDLNGVFWCSRAAARAMLPAGRGRIVNVGSVAAFAGISGRASYTTAKAGLSGLTRTLALEWAKRGIRVNTIAPGWTMTDMVRSGFDSGRLDQQALVGRIPMGRLASTDEIAAVAVFLASDAASYITGQVLPVDGGFTVNGDCP